MSHILEITSLAHGGAGIGRIDGQVCFVASALPGDVVRVRLTAHKKNFLLAEIEEIITASPDRVAHCCPDGGHRGACSWDHFAYPAQAEWKRRIVREQLARIGGIEVEPHWIEDPMLRTGYRTRAEFHGDGTHTGFMAQGTHHIVDTAHCALCHPKLNAALTRLRECGVHGEATVTVNPDGDDVLLWTAPLNGAMRAAFPQCNMPADRGARAGFVFDAAPIVNGAFAQASLLLNRLLVRCVHECLEDAASVLDLYCGNGNLTITLRGNVEVTGLDHNYAATAAAHALSGRDYQDGDEPDMCAAIEDRAWDAIVLDPPRTGAKALVTALSHVRASRVVYVSCDPATLARDLRPMIAAGWRVTRAMALDLFAHTAHIETVISLER